MPLLSWHPANTLSRAWITAGTVLLREEINLNFVWCLHIANVRALTLTVSEWRSYRSLTRSGGIWSSIRLNDVRIAEINGSGLIPLDVLFSYCTHILVSAYLHGNAGSLWPNPSLVALLRNIYKLCCFRPPPLPYLQDHTVSLPETFMIVG